jgi:hypothetical protein
LTINDPAERMVATSDPQIKDPKSSIKNDSGFGKRLVAAQNLV